MGDAGRERDRKDGRIMGIFMDGVLMGAREVGGVRKVGMGRGRNRSE